MDYTSRTIRRNVSPARRTGLYCRTPLRPYHHETFVKFYALSVLLVLLVLCTPAFAQTNTNWMETGRKYTNLFYDGKSNEIWLHLSPQMKNIFGYADAILGMHLENAGEWGAETKVIDEQVTALGESISYRREVMYQRVPTPMIIEWIFDSQGTVIGFSVRGAEAAPSSSLGYKDKASLRLPFKGDWLVLGGGRSSIQNQHAVSVDQRFAYDITAIKNGKTFSGNGSRPGQHYCFGRPIYAPGAGTIVEAKDGIPDNMIGAPFASPPEGNHVIIDHGNSEYSVLAHLKLGSVKVKAGDKVKSDTMIGRCGNSGNAETPHLHIHLQNTPILFNGEGLPMQFHDYLADKKLVSSGEPERGQTIRNEQKK